MMGLQVELRGKGTAGSEKISFSSDAWREVGRAEDVSEKFDGL